MIIYEPGLWVKSCPDR